MTEWTYRKKALPHLLSDFARHCAYCLDPDDFRHPSLNHVEHFNCKLKRRQRNKYPNLMLACAACNQTKHDKPVVNPLDPDQRFLNCTVETEFPNHIFEADDGQWHSSTKAGEYHLESIGLKESCHRQKRAARKVMADRILTLCQTAIQYKALNPSAVHDQVMGTIYDLLEMLKHFPPLVTKDGVVTVSEWLTRNGIDPHVFTRKQEKTS